MADLRYFQLSITMKNCNEREMVINKIFNKTLDSSIAQRLYILIFLRFFKEFQALSKIPFFSNLYQDFSEISMNDYDDALSYLCAINVLDNYNSPQL